MEILVILIILILLGIYMIPGFVFGIFVWDSQVSGKLDYIKRVLIHAIICLFWLPFTLWAISPWEENKSWKEFFENYNGSDRYLKKLLGRDYERLMKKYGKYIKK